MLSRLLIFFAIVFLLTSTNAIANDIHIAVASNFRPTMQLLVDAYELQTTNTVSISSGSTGKHYAQLINGAPFDLFFAADAERPRLLEESGYAIADSRFTYALGKLVLWHPTSSIVNSSVLEIAEFKYLSIANPRLAPYGRATQQTLEKLGYGIVLEAKLVMGENVAQAFQFVESGNAELGFVAYSHLLTTGLADKDNFWLVPSNYYDKIEQQAIMLRESSAASEFLAFVKSPQALKLISDMGYDLP